MAPEMFLETPFDGKAADCWACGVTAYDSCSHRVTRSRWLKMTYVKID